MKFGRILAAAVFGLLCFTGTAIAAVTQSTVTVQSPTGTYLLDDEVTAHNQISVHGTSNGTTGDMVDINCYTGSGSKQLVASVAVQADGTFSYTGSMSSMSDQTCVLRAVPAGDTSSHPPGTSSPFTGPTLAISSRTNTLLPPGPNAGTLSDFYIYESQLRGAFDYYSLGNCSVDDSYTYDPVTFNSAILDYCNAYFWLGNGLANTTGYTTPTRSEIEVDGKSGYLPGNIYSMSVPGAENHSGFPRLTYSYTRDPATGNMVIQETDEVVKCSPDATTYPPTATSCSSFAPTGIEVSQRTTQGQGGRVTTVIQSFSSTDGHSHKVDLLEDNEFFHPGKDGELDFPWTSKGMAPYTTVGQAIAGPSHPGPGSFFVRGSASVPDGGEGAAVGSATFSNAPSGVTIVGTTDASAEYSWVDLHYARTVPAKGAVNLGFSYGDAFKLSEVQGYARAAEPMFVPSVVVSKPKGGSKSKAGLVSVSGVAHDAYGLSGVSVNGTKAKLGSGGKWTAKVKLHLGSNTLSAVATNIFGNTATASVKVSFPLTLTNLKQSHGKWKKSAGTKFSFTLDASARVTLNFTRKGKKVGSVSFKAKAGHDSRSFKGKLSSGKTLKPGAYSVSVSAKSGKAKTKAKTLHFTITG